MTTCTGKGNWYCIRNFDYLELLKMECRVEDPPVLDPFLALVARHAVAQHLGQRRELELLEVTELVGQHVLAQLRIDDGHLGVGAEPGHAHLAVLPDKVVDERHDAVRDVVAPQRQRLGPGLLGQPAVLLEVAGEEAVGRAGDALRSKRPLEPPRLPPHLVQQPAGLPQERQAQETAEQEAPWHR